MKKTNQIIIVTTVLTIFSASIAVPTFAGEAGRRNTAIILAAAAVYSALQVNDRPTVVLESERHHQWNGCEDSRRYDSSRRENVRYYQNRDYCENARRYDTPRREHARYDQDRRFNNDPRRFDSSRNERARYEKDKGDDKHQSRGHGNENDKRHGHD